MQTSSELIPITGTSTAAIPKPKGYDEQIGRMVESLKSRGFAKVGVDMLDFTEICDQHILERAFDQDQELDPEVGHRWRSHAKLTIDAADAVTILPHTAYVQSPNYNPDDGGKHRSFKPIVDDVLSSRTLDYLIGFTAGIARSTVPHVFGERGGAQVGLHMISYRPDDSAPAYASPTWLHKDDEPFVAVILCGLTKNLSGGHNLISPNEGRGRVITDAFKLQKQFEMLLLTNTQSFHAVTPMISADGLPARRDVLLITFEALS